MSRLLKIVLAVVAVVVVLLVGIAVAVTLLFDPNDYRDEIAAVVEDQTGREFSIDGELGLRAFPCCAVAVDDTRLGNPPGFEEPDFASVESVRLGLQLLPLLFQQRVVVDEVTLEGLDVKLLRRKDGTANWEFDTGTAEPEPAEEPAPDDATGLPELSIAGIRIVDAALELRDDTSGTHVAIEDLDVTSGPVAAGKPIDVDVSLRARDFTSDATIGAELGAGLQFAEDTSRVDLTGIESTVDIEAGGLPGGEARVELTGAGVSANLESGVAEVRDIVAKIATGGLQLDATAAGTAGGDATALSGTLGVPRFSPRDALAALGQPPIETSDPEVLGAMELTANWSLAGERAELDSLQMRLDDSSVTGKLGTNYADFSRTTFDLQLDAIDADRYLAPTPEEAAEAGGEAAEETELPVETLRGLDATGRVAIGKLTLAGLAMQNVVASIDARNGLIKIDPSSADVYGGRYDGSIRLDVTGDVPKIQVAQSLGAVQAGGILADLYDTENVQGLLEARLDGTGSGRTTTELIRAMKGSVALDLDDAVYKGADVWYEIRKTVARLKGKPQPEAPADPQTEITELGFAGRLADGVLQSERLIAEIPFIRVQGGGAFDLLENQLDYQLQARMLSRPDFPDADDLADLEKLTIPISVRGDANDPKIGIDLQTLAKDAAVQKAQDKLLDKLGLGEPEEAEGAEATDTGEAEQPSEKDEARDLLKKGLRDLFD